jgi:acid phosphatase (class A)
LSVFEKFKGFRDSVTERSVGLIIVGIVAVAAFSSWAASTGSLSKYIGSSGPPPGYLDKTEYPDAIALLPPPPLPESPAFAVDEQLNRAILSLHGTARWDLAAEDAKIRFPDAAGSFSCALGVPIDEENTPSVYVIFRRSMIDIGMSVYPIKKHYHRQRPFLVNGQSVCTPAALKYLKKDGSYPSGHTAAGWAWALILAELAPERTDEVLARGWAFGESRAVCNVHWQSDVIQGRTLAAAVVARLHANGEFRADLDEARKEIAAARAGGLVPDRDCEAETEILASRSLAQ